MVISWHAVFCYALISSSYETGPTVSKNSTLQGKCEKRKFIRGKALGSALMGAEGQGRDRKGGLKRGSVAPGGMGL